jgi:hypothetical protein
MQSATEVTFRSAAGHLDLTAIVKDLPDRWRHVASHEAGDSLSSLSFDGPCPRGERLVVIT